MVRKITSVRDYPHCKNEVHPTSALQPFQFRLVGGPRGWRNVVKFPVI